MQVFFIYIKKNFVKKCKIFIMINLNNILIYIDKKSYMNFD